MEIPDNFQPIGIDTVVQIDSEEGEESDDNQNSLNNQGDQIILQSAHIIANDPINQQVNMTSNVEFYNVCARTFIECYSGDPLGLKPLLRQIKSIQTLCENDGHREILKDYVHSKLKGAALDLVPEEPETVKSIVVEGRMMAIKADKSNLSLTYYGRNSTRKCK